MRIDAITRYPIKGFAGESLNRVTLEPNMRLPGDRVYALRHQDRVPPIQSGWRPKKYFLQSVQTDVISQIEVRWETDQVDFRHADDSLTLSRPLQMDAQLADWMGARIPDSRGFELTYEPVGLTDEPDAFVSLTNLNTVRAIAEATQTAPNPARYRGNLVIDGVPAFTERQWVGATLHIGAVQFEVIEPIVRCLATECDWQGHRDRDFLNRLDAALQTDCCGVFLKTCVGGHLEVGDTLRVYQR